ncbi:MAG TPA: hypothetical protein PL051_00910 [Candidatus Saccharibacteria bacterium]|mgnify:CR=1 FL=1|nr:hypothetical protein [Candidatus Saccharibacteria bacterium]
MNDFDPTNTSKDDLPSATREAIEAAIAAYDEFAELDSDVSPDLYRELFQAALLDVLAREITEGNIDFSRALRELERVDADYISDQEADYGELLDMFQPETPVMLIRMTHLGFSLPGVVKRISLVPFMAASDSGVVAALNVVVLLENSEIVEEVVRIGKSSKSGRYITPQLRVLQQPETEN